MKIFSLYSYDPRDKESSFKCVGHFDNKEEPKNIISESVSYSLHLLYEVNVSPLVQGVDFTEVELLPINT